MLDWLEVCTKLERVSVKIELQMEQMEEMGDEVYEIPHDVRFDASLCRTGLLYSAITLKSLHISYSEWYIT